MHGGGSGTSAYTPEHPMCPDKTGFTWQYYVYGYPFKPAGEGLHVQCITNPEIHTTNYTTQVEVTQPTTTGPKQCQTVDGSSTGLPCQFPFKLWDISYEICVEYGGQPACPTELDKDGNAIKYGFCGPNCPLPQGYPLESVVKVAASNRP